MVDLQVNGFGGRDLRSAEVDDVLAVAADLAAAGATAFQPTIHSATVETYLVTLRAIDAARSVAASGAVGGARILGAHLEGPFLSPAWAGAHDPSTLVPVDLDLLDALLDAGEVGMVTLAPELEGALDLVARLRARGVVASVGHTDADVRTFRAAVDAGVTHLTHCWNAHRRFVARDPGPAGAALADPRVTVGLIADLEHVAPETVAFTLAAAAGRVAATTDAVAAVPGPPGEAGPLRGGRLGPVDVLARLRSLGLGWDVVSAACSATPARVVGLGPRTLVPGTVADVVVLDDRLEVERTLVAGRQVAGRR